MTSIASSCWARLSSGETSKACNASIVLPRPMAASMRPCDMMSSVAIRSATRRGWLNRKESNTIACANRMRVVSAMM